MNKLIFTFIVLFFLNNCSFNENSRIWKNKENTIDVIISNSALEHDPNPRDSLKKLFKVLKKN